jgi:hypothetical protein
MNADPKRQPVRTAFLLIRNSGNFFMDRGRPQQLDRQVWFVRQACLEQVEGVAVGSGSFARATHRVAPQDPKLLDEVAV